MTVRADRVLLRLEFWTLWLLMAAQVLGRSQIASLLFTLTFFLTLGWWLVMAAEGIGEENKSVIAIVILSGISVCLNALLTQTSVTPSYFKKLIIFWSAVLLFGAVREYRPGPEDVRFLLRGNALMACFFIGMYLAQRQQMYLLNGIVAGYLTFRFTNPNLAAVFLSAVCMVELLHFAAGFGKRRIVHLLLGTVMAYFVYGTKARNAQLLLAVFLAACLLSRRLPDRGLDRRWAPVLAGVPLWFALGYLLLVANPWVQDVFSFLIGEGKGLDSRVEIWRFALGDFLSSPLIGAYSQISGGSGASQMHNTHLDILSSYGIVVFLLVWRLLTGFWQGAGEGRLGFLCRMAFFSMLLSGIGEAILFSGGMGIYLYAGMLGVFSNFDFEQKGPLL